MVSLRQKCFFFSEKLTLSDQIIWASLKNLHYQKPTLSADNVGFFGKKPDLSERNPHYLRVQIMRVYLFISVRIFAMPAHLLIKEHPCSQDCIRISDNLKMRLEKLILFAHTDKRTFSDKPTLSAYADMWVSLR